MDLRDLSFAPTSVKTKQCDIVTVNCETLILLNRGDFKNLVCFNYITWQWHYRGGGSCSILGAQVITETKILGAQSHHFIYYQILGPCALGSATPALQHYTQQTGGDETTEWAIKIRPHYLNLTNIHGVLLRYLTLS